MEFLSSSTLDDLYSEAMNSLRLRSHFNLHSNYEEQVQRLLIAMVKGSFVEPHFHDSPHQWELFTVLKGTVKINHYSKSGEILSSRYLGEEQDSIMVTIRPNEIHSVECISETALLLEIKEGPYKRDSAKVNVNFA
ncbi:WbuC family cupin fold metalloprotein [Vibrio sp. ER1A]|uniref:WbuC family cupin fold metalloprotein n=1 Tax=Vibrio sp. ER1A TaxID=1517681 RepID=UPI0004DD605F|nr:WbuC family cupin fold metalloprotein [Vibrio sp. ER1A]KFA99290.1 WbuC [Vibrio sp. ER1A]